VCRDRRVERSLVGRFDRSSSTGQTLPIVTEDFIDGACVKDGKRRTTLRDLVKFVGETSVPASAPQTSEPFAECRPHGLGDRLARRLREGSGEAIGVGILDV
jgi:hypothetical protein